jgi:hypothetical protein
MNLLLQKPFNRKVTETSELDTAQAASRGSLPVPLPQTNWARQLPERLSPRRHGDDFR